MNLFGERITPNAHALAREFVTLDNFYVNAEVSYGGHAYTTAAISNDFVEKIWPTNYGSRGGPYLGEGGGIMRNAFGNITAPQTATSGMRSSAREKRFAVTANSPISIARVASGRRTCPGSRAASIRTTRDGISRSRQQAHRRMARGVPSVRSQRPAAGHVDRSPGQRPHQRCEFDVEDPARDDRRNDLALGRLIEAISHSVYWKESAVFVLEDDAQNGPDHVDAHRSPAFLASPFVRRGVVDSTLYTTAGVLRTMEMILGVPPMSQYDAAATPMYNAFTSTPVRRPSRIATRRFRSRR